MNSHRGRSSRPLEMAAWARTVAGWAALLALSAPPAAALPAARLRQTAPGAPLAFDGVTVVDVEQGKLVPDQRVVVVGNRIQAVGGNGTVSLPTGAHVVDAKGKYLIPGLWDLHTHPMRYTDVFYPLFIANGVTGIRDAGSVVPLDTLIQWRREIVAGTRVGPPRQLLSGQSITNYPEHCDRSQFRTDIQTCVGDAADARHFVDSLKAAGADMIKQREVKPEMYFIIAAEARRVGIPFGGHVWDINSADVSDSGAKILDHVNTSGGLDTTCWVGTGDTVGTIQKCRPVAERLVRNGTWLVPTLIRFYTEEAGIGGPTSQAIFDRFQRSISGFWAGSKLQGNWLRDAAKAGALQAATKRPSSDPGAMTLIQRLGLPILAGTDAGDGVLQSQSPGFSLPAELAMYVAEGVTPLNALQSATLNPAKLFHGTDSLGTVAPGKLADLVLLDADPLADITNTTTIRAVVANGRYYNRAALDQLLVEAKRLAEAKAAEGQRPSEEPH